MDVGFSFGEPISVADVLRGLLAGGLRTPPDDEVSYLIDEDGMFEWRSAAASDVDDVISRLADKRWEDRVVGMTLLLPGGPHGGDLLFHPGRTSVSFVIAVHPRLLPGSSCFCDLGWYLARLVPLLEPLGLSEVEALDTT
ncbi:hypothetical protein OG241_23200 [Streptomyces sp. NBC_01390]|uniref:hypothetical protein n=1 Tax=Streptomyces sp. NBC_01390 TaxID=2903850 RepID=UPI00324F1DBE